MKLLFYCSCSKNVSTAMAFLTSRITSKHILFALGVNPTARHAVKAWFQPQSLASYTFAVSCKTSIRPCSLVTQA